MSPQEQLDAKLRRGIKYLARFYPNLSESELHEVLQKCNLDEQKAFDMLVNDSFNGHKQQSMQRVQAAENRQPNSTSYIGASGQSMQSFTFQPTHRSKRTRAQFASSHVEPQAQPQIQPEPKEIEKPREVPVQAPSDFNKKQHLDSECTKLQKDVTVKLLECLKH